jgi:lipopolysaccharide export system protein LptA
LVIRADRLTLRQDKDGYQFGTALGNLATFKQKRDGVNEYIEGEAERIEYDGRAETVQFFQRAHLKRDSGDDVRGNYISYNARTEFFSVQSGKETASAGPEGRVRAVIMPRKREGDAGTDSAGAPAASAPRAQ